MSTTYESAGYTWETVRVPLLRVGDLTPSGPVERIEYFGDLRRADLTIGGQRYSRGYDDTVSRTVLAKPPVVVGHAPGDHPADGVHPISCAWCP